MSSPAIPSRSGGLWLAVGIAVAGAAAYANSLGGPFVYDDIASLADNRSIRHLATAFWPDHGHGQTVEGRPVLNLSFALNHELGGTRVWGYHVTNVLIHVLAGLTLFGLIRRTLRLPSLVRRFGAEADLLAGMTALIWTLHPLQTESVTYLVQRAESLMGLLFLFTFYAFVRSLEGDRAGIWRGLCVATFYLGIGTKEVMATALPLLLLYDCVFVSGGLRRAWRAHGGTFLALGSALLVLGVLLASNGWNRSGSIGPGIGVSPLAYALTQPAALLTYLKLSILPFPLVLDYGTLWARPGPALILQASGIAALLALTLAGLRRHPGLGFLGCWFFAILAPTSLVPGSTQMIVEHRMYLPLAAVVAAIVFGTHAFWGRRSLPVLLALAAACGWLTARRNENYRSEEGLWSDTVAHSPASEAARLNLGNAYKAEGRTDEAIAQYREALRLKPAYPEAHNNLGSIWMAMPGLLGDAIAQFEEALRLQPGYAEAHYDLGSALARIPGKLDEAILQYREALRLKPDYAEAHNNLGNALATVPGRLGDAIAEYQEALRLEPDYAGAHNNLGNAWVNMPGKRDDAIAQYQEALRLKPDYAEAHNDLGNAWVSVPGRLDDAIAQLQQALRLKPDYAEAHNNLGNAWMAVPGRRDDAIAQYREALRELPGNPIIRYNLRLALAPVKTGP